MKLRIGHKFFLALLVTSGVSVTFMLVVQRYWFERGLVQYAQAVELERLQPLVDVLVERYEANGGWGFIQGHRQWPGEYTRLARRGRPHKGGRNSPGQDAGQNAGQTPQNPGQLPANGRADGDADRRRPRPPELRMVFAPSNRAHWNRISLVDTDNQWVAGRMPRQEAVVQQVIEAGGVVVGFLQLASPTSLSDELAVAFNQQQLKAAFWAAIAAFVGTALAAAYLANSFGAPIRALARGTNDLTGGRYGTKINSSRSDELGLLAQDFNQLSVTLKKAQEARQQWVADISHELRTPIAVLQAELETLEDGLRPFDAEAVHSLGAEVRRLRRLVDDLNQLARTDAGELTLSRTQVDLSELLAETLARFADRSEELDMAVTLTAQPSTLVYGDSDRLAQLFANLMENALRYTRPGGQIQLSCQMVENRIQVAVQDSAPGVPDEALPQLFDRLYRVDPSRSRNTGASGLGLAICESIVKAHGGAISAGHSSLGGVCITVALPARGEGPS